MFINLKGIHADTLRKRGQKLLVKGDFSQAEKCFRKALNIADNTENRFNLALALINLRNFAEAEELLITVNRDFPDNILNRLSLFKVFLMQGKWQQAVQQTDFLLNAQPNDKGIIKIHHIAHDIVLREKYQLLYDLSLQANELISQKKHQQALAILKDAHQLVPDDIEILNNTGSVYMALKDFQKAYKFYEKALALDSSNTTVQKNYARAKRKLMH